jgi:hypothetical protein
MASNIATENIPVSDVDHGSVSATRIAQMSTVAAHAAGSRHGLTRAVTVEPPAIAVTSRLLAWAACPVTLRYQR